jgi:hypothetical protein
MLDQDADGAECVAGLCMLQGPDLDALLGVRIHTLSLPSQVWNQYFPLLLSMSGIEVAGLVFGILPILIEVVKSYETIAKGVRTVRHYSKEVKSISEQLNVHNGIFLNEVRLLLRSIEAEEDVEVMLSDAADRRWISKSLDDKLRSVLRDSFQICCGIIEETKDTIETLRVEMKKFDALIDQKIKVGGPCLAKHRFKRVASRPRLLTCCRANLLNRHSDV